MRSKAETQDFRKNQFSDHVSSISLYSERFWGSMVSENPKFQVVLKGSRSQRGLRTSQNFWNFHDLWSLGFQTHFLSCFFDKNSRRTIVIKLCDIFILFVAIWKLYFKKATFGKTLQITHPSKSTPWNHIFSVCGWDHKILFVGMYFFLCRGPKFDVYLLFCIYTSYILYFLPMKDRNIDIFLVISG